MSVKLRGGYFCGYWYQFYIFGIWCLLIQLVYPSVLFIIDISIGKTILNLMSMILGRYKNKRRLGGGAFGDVQLATDPNDREVALKMVSKAIIKKEPFLEQYIQGEKQCMMSLKSPYVMELYGVEEDQNKIYFVCEYCNGGDLLSLQAKQTNKAFALKQATKILSQVILGLEHIHRKGYLHRDIKLQNILVHNEKNGEVLYKVADFGFAKKLENISGTVLGTQNYMSPEIFLNQIYSYQVDMWAFGVLFYFMLNMEFPYVLTAHSSIQQKRADIIQQTKNFSYAAKVQKSNKKIMQNCTADVEDIFKRIFEIDPNKRINFYEIRLHPLFKEYFPNASKQKSFYESKTKEVNRFDRFRMERISGFHNQRLDKQPLRRPLSIDDSEVQFSPSRYMKKVKTTEENHVLELQLQKIKFLNDSADQIRHSFPSSQSQQMLIFKYNVLKYYIILLRDFKNSLNPQRFKQSHPKLSWNDYFKSQEFTQFSDLLSKFISANELKLTQLYEQCKKYSVEALAKYNKKFQTVLEREVDQNLKQLVDPLKSVYRCSTSSLYMKLKDKIQVSNVWAYLTLLVFMIHAFNNIMKEDEDGLRQIFVSFAKYKGNQDASIDFGELRQWMKERDIGQLKQIIAVLNKRYFS